MIINFYCIENVSSGRVVVRGKRTPKMQTGLPLNIKHLDAERVRLPLPINRPPKTNNPLNLIDHNSIPSYSDRTTATPEELVLLETEGKRGIVLLIKGQL